jgi:hypothetical protein
VKKFISRFKTGWLNILPHLKDRKPLVIGVAVVVVIYGFSKWSDSPAQQRIYIEKRPTDFQKGRVLGSPNKSLYEGKERKLAKTAKEILKGQQRLKNSIQNLEDKLKSLEEKPKPKPIEKPKESLPQGQSMFNSTVPSGNLHNPPRGIGPNSISGNQGAFNKPRKRRISGPSIVSFPVKSTKVAKSEGVTIPSGSYVKAKLMTGVEAGKKTIPALLQLDFAYVAPNDYRVDLTGCFALAKSQGDLSTERVQMQIYKISCVSKRGKMFERTVNGFVADDRDNSFAVLGSLNSKQDRVAGMAFLASVVEGISKAVQGAQVQHTRTPLGGSDTMVTGNQMKYALAGGAGSAASQVTKWYLKQAENLMPTINIGSGRDVYIVMQDKVVLPNEYFKKNKGGKNASVYSYLTRIAE